MLDEYGGSMFLQSEGSDLQGYSTVSQGERFRTFWIVVVPLSLGSNSSRGTARQEDVLLYRYTVVIVGSRWPETLVRQWRVVWEGPELGCCSFLYKKELISDWSEIFIFIYQTTRCQPCRPQFRLPFNFGLMEVIVCDRRSTMKNTASMSWETWHQSLLVHFWRISWTVGHRFKIHRNEWHYSNSGKTFLMMDNLKYLQIYRLKIHTIN